jgi:superfamily II DNA or RNA helicase
MNILGGLMIKLKDYQEEALKAIYEGFENEEYKQYIEMPTGSGKTITFLSFIKNRGLPSLIIVPSKELMNQVYETALLFFNKDQISRKGDRFNESFEHIHICIIHSIRDQYFKDLCQQEYDVVVFDECHRAYSNMYKKFIDEITTNFLFDFPYILGVTATPDRHDGKMIQDLFHKCSFKIEVGDLIEKKQLSDIEGFTVKTKIDMSTIDDHNGDFNLKELFKVLCTESRNNMIVDICKKEMNGRKILIFCINITHSKIINAKLNSENISSCHIDGTMDFKERKAILSAFHNGEISCLCNCQLLTEGFDEPSIDGIILARPTKSRSLFMQMIGRGLRVFKGKENCKIIDIVDAHKNPIGFNSIYDENFLPQVEKFKNLKEIKDHIKKEQLNITEFTIEKVNLINSKMIMEKQATSSMIMYLENNDIYFQHTLSFDDASFLIWYNELKKRYIDVNSKKTK